MSKASACASRAAWPASCARPRRRSLTQHARNPERNVVIGGNNLVLAPVYGPPFVRDADGGRRYATMEDFRKFVKLGYMSKWLHHSGGTVCEPTDVPVNKRHLDMLHAHMTLSDKPFMGSVTAPERAQDSVEMCEILFGKDFVQENTVMTSLININSPMQYDDVMMGALEVFAENNQAAIISPFIVGGAMAPVSVAGTLTQVLAEVLAGVAYSQLIRKGAPVIAGTFVSSIDMNSGAPTFGTPEASQVTYGCGQLFRRLGLPYRSAGSFNGSKLPDAQAAYETANSLNAGLLAGVNFMLHSAGWLEGGLVSSFEKFVMDADQLGTLHHLAKGVMADENAQAMDAIRRSGAGRSLPGLRPHPGELQELVLALGPAGLQAVRDLGRGRRTRHHAAGHRTGRETAGRLPAAGNGSGHRPGSGGLYRRQEGKHA